MLSRPVAIGTIVAAIALIAGISYLRTPEPIASSNQPITPTPQGSFLSKIQDSEAQRINNIPLPGHQLPVYESVADTSLPEVAPFLQHQFVPAVVPSATPAPQINPAAVPTATSLEKDSESPLIETLSELQSAATPETFSQQIFGGRKLSPTSAPQAATPTPQPTPTPTVTPTATLEPVGGQPTGYMMLYLMQPEARATVEREVRILLDSKVMNLYLGVLVDGTFTTDYEYLTSVVRRLNAQERTLTLSLFFSNGSAMRMHDESFPGGLFNIVEPGNFRYLIQNESKVQSMLKRSIAKALPVFDLNSSLSTQNINFAIPMLEDNLDNDSYVAMRRVTRAALQGRAEVMRNPCPGCYSDGRNNADPLGSGLESHNPDDISRLSPKDGFTLDGTGFLYPGESSPWGIPIEAVRPLKELAIDRNLRYFGLWRAGRQGLANTTTKTPPSERTYEVPTDEQATAEIDLLRHGLRPLRKRGE